MSCNRLQRKREELEGLKKYHRALLNPIFCEHLRRRKKLLQDNIYHLKFIAQDCKDWKGSDLASITRGMEVSLLKYRLARELGQEARVILNEMLSEVYPHLRDPHGLEQTVWEVFDNEDSFALMDTERNEAESKLNQAGFRLQQVHTTKEVRGDVEMREITENEITEILMKEKEVVDQDTKDLLDVLDEKKQYLQSLRELDCPPSPGTFQEL